MNQVILQPSYIPWRGLFHLIHRAELFIFFDDVQYDTYSWRNRNRIKTRQGPKWITIPVYRRGATKKGTLINEIRIVWDTPWNLNHWNTIRHAYHRAPFFEEFAPRLEEYYQRRPELLVEFTIDLTILLAELLGIQDTRFIRSSTLGASGTKTDLVLDVLQKAGATHYICGPASKSYLQEEKFREAGITFEYMVYDYPEYPQLYPPFDPQVSVLDLLFMTGPDAGRYIWGA